MATVRITDALFQRLEKIAKQYEKSVDEIVQLQMELFSSQVENPNPPEKDFKI